MSDTVYKLQKVYLQQGSWVTDKHRAIPTYYKSYETASQGFDVEVPRLHNGEGLEILAPNGKTALSFYKYLTIDKNIGED